MMFRIWPFRRKPYRRLFRYWDGSRTRWIDPLQATYRLEISVDAESCLLDLKSADDATRRAGAERLANAVRDVFGLQPIDASGRGTSNEEAVQIYCWLFDYNEALKKNGVPLWTSPQFAEPLLSNSPPQAPASDTKSFTPSISTPAA